MMASEELYGPEKRADGGRRHSETATAGQMGVKLAKIGQTASAAISKPTPPEMMTSSFAAIKMKTLSSSHHSKTTNSTFGLEDSSSFLWSGEYPEDCCEPTEEETEVDWGESNTTRPLCEAVVEEDPSEYGTGVTDPLLGQLPPEEPLIGLNWHDKSSFGAGGGHSQHDEQVIRINQVIGGLNQLTELLKEANQQETDATDQQVAEPIEISPDLTVEEMTRILRLVNLRDAAGQDVQWDLIRKLACRKRVVQDEGRNLSDGEESSLSSLDREMRGTSARYGTAAKSPELSVAFADDLPQSSAQNVKEGGEKAVNEEEEEPSLDPNELWDDRTPTEHDNDEPFNFSEVAHHGSVPLASRQDEQTDDSSAEGTHGSREAHDPFQNRDLKLLHYHESSQRTAACSSTGLAADEDEVSLTLSQVYGRKVTSDDESDGDDDDEEESVFSLECQTFSVGSSVTWEADASYAEVAVSSASSDEEEDEGEHSGSEDHRTASCGESKPDAPQERVFVSSPMRPTIGEEHEWMDQEEEDSSSSSSSESSAASSSSGSQQGQMEQQLLTEAQLVQQQAASGNLNFEASPYGETDSLEYYRHHRSDTSGLRKISRRYLRRFKAK